MHRSIALAVVGALALGGQAMAGPPPKDPSLWMRLLGRGKPPAVKAAIREARHAGDKVLVQACKAQLQQGQLSVYSAIKLAKATKGIGANETILSEFAKAYRTDLTVKQVLRLAGATVTCGANNGILRNYEEANRGRLSASQLKKLKNAIATPAREGDSASSSAGINVGGINIGGINLGGQNTGGINVGSTMHVGGINVGGTSVGGTSVGGFNF
jgi:hypothetical protein